MTKPERKLGERLRAQLLNDPAAEVFVVVCERRPRDHLFRTLGKHFDVLAQAHETRFALVRARARDLHPLAREGSVTMIELDHRLSFCVPRPQSGSTPTAPVNFDVFRRLKIGRLRERNGHGVRIAVQDTGFTPHRFIPDGRIVVRQSFCNDASSADAVGHGTAILSQILGRAESPIPGLVPEADGLAFRIFDADGATSLSAILLSNEAVLSNRSRILNMSYGGPVSSPILELSYRRLFERGVVLIAAAGNEGPAPGTMGFPARYPFVIAVAATDKRGVLCDFSSRGVAGHFGPDIATFGKSIAMARAQGTTMGDPVDGDICIASGTSFAAPIAVCCAAMLIEGDPTLKPHDVREMLRAACVPVE